MRRDFNKSRVDNNQKQIVNAFRRLGWFVLHTHDLKNACDVVVIKRGRVVAIEIKDGSKVPSKRQLSAGEERFRDAWRASDGEWRLVECLEDVEVVNKGN